MADTRETLSTDGKVLMGLLLVILFSPYLPQFPPLDQRIRVDHILVPLVTLFVLARAAAAGSVAAPAYILFYAGFIAWLCVVTVITRNGPALGYGVASKTQMIAGLDAYTRPLEALLITANARVGRRELVAFVKTFLAAGVILILIGVAQQLPLISPTHDSAFNKFIISLYSNKEHDPFYLRLIGSGFAVSIFIQYGTYALFCLLMFMTLVPQALGANLVNRRWLYFAILALALFGGFQTGSKVFYGGMGVCLFLYLLFSPLPRVAIKSVRPRHIVITAAVIGIIYLALPFVYREGSNDYMVETMFKRFDISSIYDTYFKTRFGSPDNPEAGKLFRTGAVDIMFNYPVAGLGFNVVNRTTDSLLFGILIMGGAVGGVLYLLFLTSVFYRLRTSVMRDENKTVAELGRAMLFLGIACLFIAIGFHTFIQDRSGDAFWLITGLLITVSGARFR